MDYTSRFDVMIGSISPPRGMAFQVYHSAPPNSQHAVILEVGKGTEASEIAGLETTRWIPRSR